MEGLKKFTLYLGLNDKDTRTQKINTIEAYKICNNILLSYTEGATIFEANGIYKHQDGTFTVEKTLRIELLFTDKNTVTKIVNDLKKVFNQESVAVQEENIISELM